MGRVDQALHTMTKTANQEASDKEFREGLKRGRVFVSWRLLRSIGNSKAAKLTILIPLIGYLILLNDTVIKHLELSEEVFGAPSGATLTKLLIIYCGLVFVAVASTIFVARCPLEVKRYASSEEYVAGEERFMSERAIGIMQNRLKIGDEIARKDDTGYRELQNSMRPADDPDIRWRRLRDFIRIQMNLYFEMLDRSRLVARWATAICYAVGIGLLLIPSAMVFFQVMRVLVHKIGMGDRL
jgi:hypothetical protein